MNRSTTAFSRFLQRRAVWVVAAFYLSLPLVGWGALKAIQANSNDVKRWLPDAYPETKSLEWYQETFGMGSDAGVVMVWPDCRVRRVDRPLASGELPDDGAAPRIEAHETIARLVSLLRAAKLDPANPESGPLLIRVTSGPETLAEMTRAPTPDDEDVLGLTYEEAERRLEGAILGPDYVHGLLFDLESPAPATLSRVEKESSAEAQGLAGGDLVLSVNGIPTPDAHVARRVLKESLASAAAGVVTLELAGGRKIQWPWRGPPPGRQTGVIATLSEPASDQRNLERSVGRIREIAAEAGIAPHDLRLGGPPVDNVAIDTEGRKTLMRLAGLSFGVGLIMCWVCLGNLKLTLLVFFTSLFSEGTSLAMVWWTGGEVDAILMSLPTLVYLLTISGAIHIANYYRDSLPEVGSADAPALSVSKGFIPCILAAGTTAVGMGSLYVSDLAPIRNFGVYSALAVMTTLLWIFFFIPANLQVWPLREKRKPGVSHHAPRPLFAPIVRLAGQVGEGILRGRTWITAAAFASTVLLCLGIFGLQLRVGGKEFNVPSLRTSVKLMELFSDDTQIVHDYQWIENRLADLVPMEVVIATENCETILIRGEASEGQYVIAFRDSDGLPLETQPLSTNAAAQEVQAALRAAGMERAVVEPGVTPHGAGLRVAIEGGGPVPYLEIETQGELTEEDVKVAHAPLMVERMRLVDEARRNIVALPQVSTTLSAVTFAPQLPDIGKGWSTRVSQVEDALNRSRGKLVESGFFAQQTGQDLYRVSLRIGAFSDVDYSRFVAAIQQAVDPLVLAMVLEHASAAANQGQPLLGWQITRQERNPATGEAVFHYLHQSQGDDDPRETTQRIGRVQRAADGAVTAEIDGNVVFAGPFEALTVRPTYTGIVPLVYKAQNELMRSLYTSYAWAFGMIVVVMIPPLWKMVGALKGIPAALLIMLPSFYPTAVVFGMMGMLRMPLDVGTMMTASVALGIALDDTVHFLIWFDRGVKEHGMTRKQACRYAYSQCARPMVQTTTVACIGMSVFMLSTFQPTMQFGLFMVPLMAVALFGDLVILPALLASPLGWFFVRSGQRQHDGGGRPLPRHGTQLERPAVLLDHAAREK